MEGEDDHETLAQETLEVASKIGEGYIEGVTGAGSIWEIGK